MSAPDSGDARTQAVNQYRKVFLQHREYETRVKKRKFMLACCSCDCGGWRERGVVFGGPSRRLALGGLCGDVWWVSGQVLALGDCWLARGKRMFASPLHFVHGVLANSYLQPANWLLSGCLDVCGCLRDTNEHSRASCCILTCKPVIFVTCCGCWLLF